jgi:type I restriction enzyme S subunit
MNCAEIPLRRLARFVYGEALAREVRSDGDVPVVGSGGISGSHSTSNTQGPAIVVGRKGSFGSVTWVEDDCFVIDTAYEVRPLSDDEVDRRWLFYALQSVDLRGVSRDVGVPGLSREAAYGILVPKVGVSEQRRVVKFLDCKLAELDSLYAARRRDDSLIEERLVVSLVDAVLGRRAAGSGRPARLKYLFDSVQAGLWGDEPVDGPEDVVCVRVADFIRGEYRADPGAKTMRSVPVGAARGRLLRPGDILLEKSGGGDLNPVGFAVSFDGVPRSICSNFVAALRPAADVHPRFACLLLAALYRTGRNVPHVKQSTGIQNLDVAGYLSERVSIPDYSEQRSVAERFDVHLVEVGRLRSVLDRQLRVLQERRQALITAAVTGQVDVSTASGVAV